MEKVSKAEQKSTPPHPRNCPDCGHPVDLTGPCWMRISPRPDRTTAWHLECRDRHLASLSKAAYRSREEREQFAAALAMLGRISVAVGSAGDTISEGEALAIIRGLVGGGEKL